MARIDVIIDDEIMTRLKCRLGVSSNIKVIEEALTILNWAAGEKIAGKVILSAFENGSDVVRLSMKCLKNE